MNMASQTQFESHQGLSVKSSSCVKVSLTGGLGNQLFQLAAAFSLQPSSITLLTRFGLPRMTAGIPDVSHYKLPSTVELELNNSDPKFYRKVVGYLLRTGVNPKPFEKNAAFAFLVKFLSHAILAYRFKKMMQICVGQGVGYSKIELNRANAILVGYFQTERHLNSAGVEDLLKSLELNVEPQILKEYKSLAKAELPLVVHVRLGDYRTEEKFGIVTKSYYECVEKLWGSNSYRKIWLFSDEPREAIEMIPDHLVQHVRVVSDALETPATTLELMRLGKGYVIANSSLSWWGAKLSKTENPIVFAPFPWFKAMPEPVDLIPANWHRQAGFD